MTTLLLVKLPNETDLRIFEVSNLTSLNVGTSGHFGFQGRPAESSSSGENIYCFAAGQWESFYTEVSK